MASDLVGDTGIEPVTSSVWTTSARQIRPRSAARRTLNSLVP